MFIINPIHCVGCNCTNLTKFKKNIQHLNIEQNAFQLKYNQIVGFLGPVRRHSSHQTLIINYQSYIPFMLVVNSQRYYQNRTIEYTTEKSAKTHT